MCNGGVTRAESWTIFHTFASIFAATAPHPRWRRKLLIPEHLLLYFHTYSLTYSFTHSITYSLAYIFTYFILVQYLLTYFVFPQQLDFCRECKEQFRAGHSCHGTAAEPTRAAQRASVSKQRFFKCLRFRTSYFACTNSVTLVFQVIWLVRYLWLMDNVHLLGIE